MTDIIAWFTDKGSCCFPLWWLGSGLYIILNPLLV